jgi:hypothetical protein
MTIVTIESEMYEGLEHAASELHMTVEAVVSEAVQRYLWDLRRRAVASQADAWRLQPAESRRQYANLFVAIYDGSVVDSGPDFLELLGRVRKKWGDAPVMVTQVTDEPESTFSRRGFVVVGEDS